ncbi:MAG: hypothetical protein ACJAZO_004877 [Myxococcota bacterium]|jgi:hypothetical protein
MTALIESEPGFIQLPEPPLCDSLCSATSVICPVVEVSAAAANSAVGVVRDALCEDLTLGEALDDWIGKLDAWNRRGQQVWLWGPAERAVAFLALINRGVPIDGLITDDPGFLGGSGLPTARPTQLVEDPPDVVITVGPDTIDQVRAILDGFGLGPRVYELT